MKPAPSPASLRGPGLIALLVVLGALLGLLFFRSFLPGCVLFSNDGPLGRLVAQCHHMPGRFLGAWWDLNFLGTNEGRTPPTLSFGLQYLLGPVCFSKFYGPLSLLILGIAAWGFFRRAGLAPAACLLGGVAAALNSDFFSVTCWGLGSHALAVAMSFAALAALVAPFAGWQRLRLVLAGMAVGMAVMEGADTGAILSLLVAAFVTWQAWLGDGSRWKRLGIGLGRVVLIAACAGCLAAHAILALVSSNIEGVVGMATTEDTQAQEAHWDWATQWSLPKRETLSLVVPGLFGYRDDTPGGAEYWGAVGRAPALDRFLENGREGQAPPGYLRYSGSGFYAGVLVVVLAVWASLQSLRGKHSVFSPAQRRWLRFWIVAGLVSLLLAFGRFAPFYRLFYALPYLSTIRNPIKFLYVVHLALVVLFAYGVDGLWRKYLQAANGEAKPGLKQWWSRATVFEKRWVRGGCFVLAAGIAAWVLYISSRDTLEEYLQLMLFSPEDARAIAGFSLLQPGWFLLFFALASGLLVWIFAGAFAGARARWAGALLGVLLVADLGRANLPWITYWNYPQRYSSNAILEALCQKPYEHRVALIPSDPAAEPTLLNQLYFVLWMQHHFPFYNIQAVETVGGRSKRQDSTTFQNAFAPNSGAGVADGITRYWQLTNARYLLGERTSAARLMASLHSAKHQFQVLQTFDLVPKPGIVNPRELEGFTAVPAPNGRFALFEFADALPRVKLYSEWQVMTNDESTLEQLANPLFAPAHRVLVAGNLAAAPAPGGEGVAQSGGTVQFTSYTPRKLVLKADATSPSVLLLNDRFDPDWQVWVDGKPQALLRCNFIMRGVFLPRGAHLVEFRFRPPVKLFYVSLGCVAAGLLLFGYGLVAQCRTRFSAPALSPQPPAPAPRAAPQPGQRRSPRAARLTRGQT